MTPDGSFESWLWVMSPYFITLVPTVLGFLNRRKLTDLQNTTTNLQNTTTTKLATLQETTDRVESNGDGHTTALIAMAAAIDPEVAATAARAVVEATKLDAAAVLKTAADLRGEENAARKG